MATTPARALRLVSLGRKESDPALATTALLESIHVQRFQYETAATANASIEVPGWGASQIPQWAIGLFTGIAAFGMVFAVVLALVNFRSNLSCLGMFMPRRRNYQGYSAVAIKENEESNGSRRMAGVARMMEDNEVDSYTTSTSGNQADRRHGNGLRINASAKYEGLGIAIPGYVQGTAGMARPRRPSYDEERLRRREQPPMSPARWVWEALTAPLPSISGFAKTPRKDQDDVELRRYLYTHVKHKPIPQTSGQAPTGQNSTTRDPDSGSVERETPRYNVLEHIDHGVQHVARSLAQMMDGEVSSDAEAGLIFLVKDNERERFGY